MIHELKTWPDYYEHLVTGRKTFELRRNDRAYREGDTLHLREYEPVNRTYTGREMQRVVTYMLATDMSGDFVVMALGPHKALNAGATPPAEVAPASAPPSSSSCADRETRIAAGDWRPIETAPKDGTWVLGMIPMPGIGPDDYDVRRVSWGQSRHHGLQWCSGGAWHNPTRWIPLPQSPSPSSGTATSSATDMDEVPVTEMTRDEWFRRYRQRFIDRAGLTADQADDCANAETFEVLSESFEDDPEGAADEEMSYWDYDWDDQ